MSFSSLRASLRRSAFRASFPRAQPKNAFRRFSTPPPVEEVAKKSSTGLFVGLGALFATGGFGYFYLNSDAAPSISSKAKFVPTQEDYQKVHVDPLVATINVTNVRRSTTKLLKFLTRLGNTMVCMLI